MANNTLNNNLMAYNDNQISLRPGWYGKINWADWRSINPKMVDYYERNKNINISKYWGDFISPSYDDRKEYINGIKQNNSQYSLDYEHNNRFKNKHSRRNKSKNKYKNNYNYKTDKYIYDFIDENANEYVNEYIVKYTEPDTNELENIIELDKNEIDEILSDPDNYEEY